MDRPEFSHYGAHITQICRAALAAADPVTAVSENLRVEGPYFHIGPYRYQLGRGRVFLVGTGKASLRMGQAAIQILGKTLHAGILVTKRADGGTSHEPRVYQSRVSGGVTVQIYEAGHPTADESSLLATRAVTELLRQAGPADLVLTLISGGTSALLSAPTIPLPAWRALTAALVRSGCTIEELNCVRRQLDTIKGGGLAAAAAPAACASLILSDVVGNSLPAIGSGPTVEVHETPAEAFAILTRYEIAGALPPDYWQEIEHALAATKPSFLHGVQVVNLIIGDVRRAGEAAVRAAHSLGFEAQLLSAHLQGEAREVGRVAAALAIDARPAQCLILGGETTVTVKGDGVGGRNQELALAAAITLEQQPGVAVAGFATDGEDGPTDAAGAIVTGETAQRGRRVGLDPQQFLRRNDSHTFFTRLAQRGMDCLIRTGATGTNVNDLLIILKYPGEA